MKASPSWSTSVPAPEHWTARLCRELCVDPPGAAPADEPECLAWARSGAMAVTGRADGPPLLGRGAPVRWTQHALGVLAAWCGGAVATPRLLGARAATMGHGRRAPSSAGGASRLVRSRDGWLAISLGRTTDRERVPALVGDAGAADDPWDAIQLWLERVTAVEAQERAALLGMAAAAVPGTPLPPGRPPVVPTKGGGNRRRGDAPLVVDLSSLWAGPLCAQLLHRAGARVVTVESRRRLDGSRRGSPAFYEALHDGHESVVLDFDTELDALAKLIRSADVVIEASRPRALCQLGINAGAHVAAGAVWVGITAYGREGDAGLRIGFGDDVAAGAGHIVFDAGVPCFVGDALADPLTGVTAAAAAALALQAGGGWLLDVSMHHTAAAAAILDPGPSGTVVAGEAGWEVTCGDRRVAVAGGPHRSGRPAAADQVLDAGPRSWRARSTS